MSPFSFFAPVVRETSMSRSTFQRALDSLSHPVAVSVVLILLVNDYLLKPYSPSWWTGKLSDAAWLVIMPLVIAALVALIVPPRAQHAERIIGPAAFVPCAVCFTALKASPETNRWLLESARRLTGIPWHTLSDPSDLLVLPVIGIGWLLWARSNHKVSRPSARRWPVLALAALALLADAPAPFHAIACLRQDGDTITAFPDFGSNSYISTDGGMSWRSAPPGSVDQLNCAHHDGAWEISQPGDDQVRYRLIYGEGIDRSADGGKTWQREISLNNDEARYYYYRKFVAYQAGPGPYDAVFDNHTRNLIVAMGFEGALVRDTGGKWSPVAVGDYHHEDLSADLISALLSGEIGLAVILVFLSFALLDKVASGFRRWDIVLAVTGWLLWGGGVLIAPANIRIAGDYISRPMVIMCMLGSAISGVIGVVGGKIWKRRRSSILRGAALSLCGALLFLLPFLLWGQGTIERYQTAQIAAVVMMLIFLASSIVGMFKNRKASQASVVSS